MRQKIFRDKIASENFLANINTNLREDNIDFWFIVNAYEEIAHWFDEKGQKPAVMGNLNNFFTYNVKVIWYEVDETEDAAAMFTRLNIGKIPLTSSELVKAAFLSNENADEHRQNEIALQWDNLDLRGVWSTFTPSIRRISARRNSGASGSNFIGRTGNFTRRK